MLGSIREREAVDAGKPENTSDDGDEQPTSETAKGILRRKSLSLSNLSPTRVRPPLTKYNSMLAVGERSSLRCNQGNGHAVFAKISSSFKPVFKSHHADRSPDSEKGFKLHGKGGQAVLGITGLYGTLIVVLGVVVPVSECFLKADQPGTALKVFYIYLFLVSTLFLTYVYCFCLHDGMEALKAMRSCIVSLTRSRDNNDVESNDEESESVFYQESEVESTSNYYKRKWAYDGKSSGNSTGSFYLRLGAVAFGLGGTIQNGLELSQYAERKALGKQADSVAAVKSLCQLIFTFAQMVFIFKHSKICILDQQALAHFGFMHMCATNLCVWVRCIVKETLHGLHVYYKGQGHHDSHHDNHDNHGHSADVTYNASFAHHVGNHSNMSVVETHLSNMSSMATPLSNMSAHEKELAPNMVMGEILDRSIPFLYPLTIEYSLICAGIFYVMWKNVGKKQKYVTLESFSEEDLMGGSHLAKMSVDCSKSSRGLFLGLLVLIATIISTIVYDVLYGTERGGERASLLADVTIICVYVISLIAVVIAAVKMRTLKLGPPEKDKLEQNLLLVSLQGLFAYASFTGVACMFAAHVQYFEVLLLRDFLTILEASAQTLFIIGAMRFRARHTSHQQKKPGKECVTLLLLCNLALWITNTFETQRWDYKPVPLEFYGPYAWAIFTRVSVPLGIFYRFHSSVCLSHIWKDAWKLR